MTSSCYLHWFKIFFGLFLFQLILIFESRASKLPLYYSTEFSRPEHLDTIKKLYRKSRLQTDTNSVNLGFKANSGWVVFHIPKNQNEQIISIQNAFLDSVKVYFYRGEKLITSKESGDDLPFHKRDINNNFINFLVPPKASLCYMYVYTSGPLQIPVKVLTFTSYVHYIQGYFGIHCLYFGFVLLIVVSNFLIFFWLKNRLYLYYILSVLSIGIITAVDFGYTFQYLWPDYPILNKYTLVAYLFSFFFILFTEKLLNVKERCRNLYIFYTISYVVFAVVAVTAFLIPYKIAIQIIYYLFISVPVFSFISGIVLYKAFNNATVRFFLIGWIALFISVFIYLLTVNGTLPYNLFTSNVMQIGSCIEITFFNLAILSKISIIKRENEILLSQQNKLLEEKVELRTRELHEQSNEIKKKNILLQYQQEHLERLVEERTQELVLTNKELLDKNTRLEQFANVTAHNLRGPVATLLGLCEIYNLSAPDDPLNIIILKNSKETTLKIDSILRDLSYLLDLNKNLKALAEKVDLNKLLQDIKVLLQSEIEKNAALIVTDFAAFNHITTIPAYINNIFYNLISNGIKFRKKDTIPMVSIKTSFENNIPIIIFKDNGIGIDLKANGDKLFQPYKRFELSTQGKGLGLHITRTQIEAMGGHIEVESQPGTGTTFKVYFPISDEKKYVGLKAGDNKEVTLSSH